MVKRALVLLGLVACKKTPVPAVVDASAPVVTATATASEATPVVDAGPPPPPPMPIPTAFSLVGYGKADFVWIKATASHTWLSLKGSDAMADGDGPLVKTTDPLAKLPYQGGKDSLSVVGDYPHLFALRTKMVESRGIPVEPAVFMLRDDGTWKQSEPIKNDLNAPEAFLPYRDGVLYVTAQVANGNPQTNLTGPGTIARFIGPDGKISDAKLPIPSDFVAWNGESANGTVTLLGTTIAKGHAAGMQLLRIDDQGAHLTPITHANLENVMVYMTDMHENGDHAVAMALDSTYAEQMGWKPNAHTLFIADNSGKPLARTVPGDADASVVDARVVGDELFVIRRSGGNQLFHVDATGKATKMTLPPIDKTANCEPKRIVARGNDVWVTAECDERHAVYRGKAQATPFKW